LNLLYYTAADDGSRWLEAIARELPEATLRSWPEVGAPADYALVWKPPSAMPEPSPLTMVAWFYPLVGVQPCATKP